MADKFQALSNMSTRQKATAGVVALIFLIILWQVWGMFSSGQPAEPVPAKPTASKNGAAGAPVSPGQMKPKAEVQVPKPEMTPEMAELMKEQQATEARYMQALSQLQMLKVARDIADSNRDIMKAKLDAVTAEKKIVDMLSAPVPTAGDYSKSLVNPTGATPTGPGGKPMAGPIVPQEITYTVVSVTELQNRWSAVLGSQGNLYSVHVGDVLPPDGSVVVSISRSGVVIEKDGVRKKVSMVSII